jgi:pyruvate dehydrogenase E2 component (dihydrolipoamide acetyltransferase)
VNFRLVSAATVVALLAACTPKPETDGAIASAPAAPPAADIAAPAPDPAAAAPNNSDTLSNTLPAAAAPAAPATTPASPPAAAAATPAEIAAGRAAYARTCAMCHGPAGQGTTMGIALTTKDPAAIAEKITKGGEKMPPMASMLQAEEIDDISKFVAAGLPQ